MKRIGFLFLILGLSVFSTAAVMSSESDSKCAIPPFETEYESSTAVFIGHVTAIVKEGNKEVVTFEVEQFWKGIDSKTLEIRVFENVRFQSPYEEGKTYLVFAKKDEDSEELFDQRCSRSAEIGSESYGLKDDLEKLGKAKTCISLNKDNK